MNNYSITYNDALQICKKYRDFNFYETLFRVDRFKVSVFNYFICTYDHFAFPLGQDNPINAFDMRGLTFVFNEDGSLYRKYLMLPKFFNINQVESTQYDLIKDKKIKNVSFKEDGTLIAFMLLPNGDIFAKTKGGIYNDQSIKALSIVNSSVKYKSFIKNCLIKDLTPLFEYVSFDNRIVLQYNNPELIFIGVRNNKTGEYINGYEYYKDNSIPFKITKSISFNSIEDIVNESKEKENLEGWVIEFEDGQLVKIKTQWYFNAHNLRTMSVFREDYVIENYLKETLDDVICQLDPTLDSDAIVFINNVVKATDNYSLYIDNEVNKLLLKFNGNWKEYATNNAKHHLFMLSKVKICGAEHYNKAKVDYILKRIYKLSEAKLVVDKYKNYKI